MNVRKRIVKGVGYTVAPKATFAALHPRKAAVAKATSWALGRIAPSRQRRSRTRMVATGVGAAAMTVPLGIWLGRRLRSMQHRDETATA
jgi:hypothetical protein